jgi:hypothetical protein
MELLKNDGEELKKKLSDKFYKTTYHKDEMLMTVDWIVDVMEENLAKHNCSDVYLQTYQFRNILKDFLQNVYTEKNIEFPARDGSDERGLESWETNVKNVEKGSTYETYSDNVARLWYKFGISDKLVDRYCDIVINMYKEQENLVLCNHPNTKRLPADFEEKMKDAFKKGKRIYNKEVSEQKDRELGRVSHYYDSDSY